MTTNGSVTDLTSLNGSGVMELNLRISDLELLEILSEYEEGRQRHDFAVSALRIGTIALRQAQGRLDAERVRQEGDRLIENMKHDLAAYQKDITAQINDCLKDYFDPNNGMFNTRIEHLVKNDGELESVIRSLIGGDGSELARTLAEHIGTESPLMQKLDPSASDGLINMLSKSTEETLSAQREQILREFSLDNRDGALSRLVRELNDKHGEVGELLENRISDVIDEFSLDKEDSALSRLVARVETAQKQLNSEFSLDQEGSALARMRKDLLEVMEQQGQKNERFQNDVIEKLAFMTAQKQESQRSTQHGVDFEDSVFKLISEQSQKAGDIATSTGNTTGLIKNNKKGDAVIELNPEHVAAGERIVVEAKQNASYNLDKALSEIQEARKNRGASVGLFIFSARTAPSELEWFHRYGDDIVVVWNEYDPHSDVYLYAGLSVAKALCTRARSHSEQVGAGIKAVEQAILTVEKQMEGFAEITRLTTTIKNNSENVLKRARIMNESIGEQIEILNEKVGSLR